MYLIKYITISLIIYNDKCYCCKKKTNVSIYTTVIFMNYISYLKLVDMT